MDEVPEGEVVVEVMLAVRSASTVVEAVINAPKASVASRISEARLDVIGDLQLAVIESVSVVAVEEVPLPRCLPDEEDVAVALARSWPPSPVAVAEAGDIRIGIRRGVIIAETS